MATEFEKVVAQGRKRRNVGWDKKGRRGTFLDNENALYLHKGSGYKLTHSCRNAQNHMLKIWALKKFFFNYITSRK